MEKPWFQRRFPHFVECVVDFRPRSTSCHGGGRKHTPGCVEVVIGHISMSSWGMGIKHGRGGEIVVLHELAHAVLPYNHNHDRRWARTFIEFIGCMMSQDVKKILMEEFRIQNVPFSPVKKVIFTLEHMAKLAASRPIREKNG